MILQVVIIAAALGGLSLAWWIRRKKRTGGKMVCPLNSNCEAVVHSRFSRFLGMPVEALGIAYYAAAAASYLAFLLLPSAVPPVLGFLVLIATVAAFLFSAYLVFIQAFTLKQWCTWCLTSAGLCTVIFLTALSTSANELVEFLGVSRPIVLVLHAVGAAVGLGGATIADVLFFRFLKDFKISEWESEVLAALSQIIWFALAVLVVTGAGLYFSDMEALHKSSKFLVKVIAVGVIIVNGAFLNLLVSPKLVQISFGEKHDHHPGELHHMRKVAFALGAISITSWYFAFVLGSLRSVPIGFAPLLFAYLAVVAAAVFGSQLFERSFARRHE
jgi:uncharacterized membrane protein